MSHSVRNYIAVLLAIGLPLFTGNALAAIISMQQVLQTQDKIIKFFPEVSSVFGKAGRALTATDLAPLECPRR